jgi:hypothetical protein
MMADETDRPPPPVHSIIGRQAIVQNRTDPVGRQAPMKRIDHDEIHADRQVASSEG